MPPSHAQTYKEIFWDELIPPEWARQTAKEFAKLYKKSDSMQDSDPRIDALYEKLRKHWDAAPISKKYIGKPIRISGYVVPLDAERSLSREFFFPLFWGLYPHAPATGKPNHIGGAPSYRRLKSEKHGCYLG